MINYVYIATSLDGYISDANNKIDWLPSPESANFGIDYNSFMDKVDAIIMGKNTYEMVLSFGIGWPYKKPVFVLSNSLTLVPDGLTDKVTLLKGNIAEILQKINQQGYNNFYIDGGKTIQNFLKEDLIDELIITVIPILLGGGSPLFAELPKHLKFKHLKTSTLNNIVQSHYQRER